MQPIFPGLDPEHGKLEHPADIPRYRALDGPAFSDIDRILFAGHPIREKRIMNFIQQRSSNVLTENASVLVFDDEMLSQSGSQLVFAGVSTDVHNSVSSV